MRAQHRDLGLQTGDPVGVPSGPAFVDLGLSRESAGLVPYRLPDGGYGVDLQGRFMSATVARVGEDGDVEWMPGYPVDTNVGADDGEAHSLDTADNLMSTREALVVIGNLLLMIAVSVWAVAEGGMDQAVSTGLMVTIVSLGYGALAANAVSVAVLVSDTLMSRQ